MEFDQILKQGDTLHIAIVGNIMGSNTVPDVRNEVERLTVYQLTEGYERLWKRHNTAWDKLWMSDIQITGDPQAQQDIHSMLYHHYAFYREGNAWSCSPMGLSGLGYNGHCFWDTETWMYPVLLVLQPQFAKETLDYRFQRLDRAKQKAYFYGYKGALFPWESADSGQEEVAPHNMYPNAEHHITGDVAIAAWQYYCVTQDKEWLREKGYSLIAEPADFWVSRAEYDELGRANLYNVIGADEWSSNDLGGKLIDNNAYTLGVAKTNLYYATQAAHVLSIKPKKEWNTTANAFQFQYLDNGVIKEYDTYNGQVTKQADVSLLAYPLRIVTDTAQIRKNLEYYIAKVPVKKTPAMSKSVYSVLYARLGKAEQALHYFYDSYLPNLNPPFRVIAEFNGGTNPYFITGAGGTLQAIIFGFAGLEITDKGLKQVYTPILPKEWSSLTIRVAGKEIVHVNKNE
jgi:trehalose/maltose hydrolase-like predicted phosphorylase